MKNITVQKIISLCRHGVSRNVLSEAEFKSVEKFFGRNVRKPVAGKKKEIETSPAAAR